MADAQERPAAGPRGLGRIPRDAAGQRGLGEIPRDATGPASSWRPRLMRAVAEAVDAVPGVVRRESSVADFVRSLRVAGRRGAAEAVAAEGVRVRASGSPRT
ncbi:hypothetical protein NBM05_04945 [Rothia sp. AR01]|uniref:Uncharacterized protein n=1 Tax=Rothia santali TaxID=2949643 RepID=A0A9X2KHX2_9MICC|nr:hypothetical protein [Rothia santali]MCP3425380.1 hypothetical protein [Rothia santali]